MQTPVDDSDIFTMVSRSVQASPSPRWSPSQGPSFRLGNSMDSSRPSPRTSGSPVCLPLILSQTPPCRLHYQASGWNAASLVPFGTRWRPHHKRSWCGLARLKARQVWQWCALAPKITMYANLTNTRSKPRANAIIDGLTNLSTSENTYANHRVFH